MVGVRKAVNVFHFNYSSNPPTPTHPLNNMEQITFQTLGKNKP